MSLILVIDDDADFRALARCSLERRGHEVVEAESRRGADRKLAQLQPDLIIVDGLLPDGSGISWIEERRRGGDETAIVFVSAFWRDLQSFQQLTDTLRVGAVLHKPLTGDDLAAEVDAALCRAAPSVGPVVSFGGPVAAPEENLGMELDAGDLFGDLIADYRAALPARIESLCVLIDQAQRRPPERAAIEGMRAAAHRMAGTAGTYGCGDVGTAAAALEDLSRAVLEGGVVSPFTWARARAGLERAAADLAAAGPTVEPPAARSCTRRLSLQRVLLVDDDPEFLLAVHSAGRTRGITVVGVIDAEAALARAAEETFDAAIIDVRLDPDGASSFQLARDLRALPGRADLPLAFVSAYGEVDDRIAATHAGATLFLSKPLDAQALATAVDLLTAARRATRPRLLIVDDDPDFIAYAADALGADMEIASVTDGRLVLDMLDEVLPDVILLDTTMSGVCGLDLCRTIRSIPRWQQVSILFATAGTDVTARVDAFRAGADDYLSKPVLREELVARVKVRVERSRMLRDRLENDALTGLPLRRVFLEHLSARLGEARRRRRNVTVALLDVDHFKQVNDGHGHLAGDRVLAELGSMLKRRFRAEDLRGRWGGEEFALAFVEESPETVAVILQRVLSEFAALRFTGADGQEFACTFSAGVAGWPEDGDQLDGLLATADSRLYAAKAAGRNCVVGAPAPVLPSAHAADARDRRAG